MADNDGSLACCSVTSEQQIYWLLWVLLTGLICNSLSLSFTFWKISDSRDADSISLDSADEDGARRSLQGAVTSMDEALMKVTGAAEHAQEDFLTQNFGPLNQSRSAGRRKQTPTSKGILGHSGPTWIRKSIY